SPPTASSSSPTSPPGPCATSHRHSPACLRPGPTAGASNRAAAMIGGVEVLRQANFRLLFTARTISFFGSNLVPIAVAFAVLDLTGSATDVGIAFAARTLAQIATLLVGGVVADRLPRQRVMIGSELASMLVQVALAVLLLSGEATIWQLVGLQALGGAPFAVFTPGSPRLAPPTLPPSLPPRATG